MSWPAQRLDHPLRAHVGRAQDGERDADNGAGGIGVSLYENVRGFQYSETATIVIIVVLAVMLIDLISARIRKVLV